MIFSSIEFLYLFLPFTVLMYYFALSRWSYQVAISCILLASLFFYGYWNPHNVILLISSVIINYCLGRMLASSPSRDINEEKQVAITHIPWQRKILFCIGILFNVLVLFYYKYMYFFSDNLNYYFHTNILLNEIALPIGLSFITFQQIAFLADMYSRKHVFEGGFIQYSCFICFFPQLVAGPIVHHSYIIPQFADQNNHQVKWGNLYLGLCYLTIGLVKKVLIANNLAPIVDFGFDTSAELSVLDAVFSSLCYTLQIYFDFSGYIDMAIGCALFFNIHLPENFNMPYRARNIQEFWRRWHITLSDWLRDYIYIPLGGSKVHSFRMMGNLLLTFLIGGLWHGAAWTFLLWGALHGLALIIHRLWKNVFGYKMPFIVAWSITFLFINITWIIFRAENVDVLEKFMTAFTGVNGISFSDAFNACLSSVFEGISSVKIRQLILFFTLLAFVNDRKLIQTHCRYFYLFTVVICILLCSSLYMVLEHSEYQPFLYFDF